MSHITQVKTEFKSLELLEAAFTQLGMVVTRNQSRFKWYGRFVGDTAGLPGVPVEDYNKCNHVAKMANAQTGDYEIGIIETENGIECRFDTWRQQRLMAAVGGPNLGFVKREYAKQVADASAFAMARRGFAMHREQVAGRTRIRFVRR